MRGIKRIVGLTVLLAVLFGTTAALAAGSFYMVSGTTSLNLRAEANQYSTWLGSYNSGTWVEVLTTSGNWYYVKTNDGRYGYMSGNYLTTGSTITRTIGFVTNAKDTQFLNLRMSPSYSSVVLGIFYNGTPCLINGYQDGWYQVTVNGINGYFRSEYIQTASMAGSGTVATIKTPNNSGLNLRSGPGKEYSSIGQYYGDTYVMVLSKGKDWWQVSARGTVGFMSTEYLKAGLQTNRDIEAAKDFNGGGGTSSSGTPSGNRYAVVTNPISTQYLNLREKPTTASKALGQYRNGVQVAVLSQGTSWCKVSVDGVTGYMMTRYLTLYNLPGVPTKTIVQAQKTYVNLRSGASLLASVTMRVPHGSTVTVVTPGDEWTEVNYNGTIGYIMSYFLK